MKYPLFLAALAVTAVATAGCGDADNNDTEESNEISLRTDVMPIFAANCAGCHARENGIPEAVVNMAYLESPEDIMANVGTFIMAGDSANSGFVGVLRQDFGVGAGMTVMPPPPASALSAADVEVFAQWIDEGAKDN